MLKVLGVGLSRTGTTSLTAALQILGLKCLHYDRERLTDIVLGENQAPDFRCYDDLDAVTDLPAAHFYRELMAAYPEARAVLTVRPVADWWHSVQRHFNDNYPVDPVKAVREGTPSLLDGLFGSNDVSHNRFRLHLRSLVYGSWRASEYLYTRAFEDHNARVRRELPAERLLVLDITSGAGWAPLCEFLGLPVPDTPFPWKNRTDPDP